MDIQLVLEDHQCKPIMAPSTGALDLKVQEGFEIKPGETRVVPMGFQVSLPPGIFGCIRTRPNMNGLTGLVVYNSVLDNDFVGPVKCQFTNVSDHPIKVKQYDKTAQMILLEPLVPCSIW